MKAKVIEGDNDGHIADPLFEGELEAIPRMGEKVIIGDDWFRVEDVAWFVRGGGLNVIIRVGETE